MGQTNDQNAADYSPLPRRGEGRDEGATYFIGDEVTSLWLGFYWCTISLTGEFLVVQWLVKMLGALLTELIFCGIILLFFGSRSSFC
jgi:hypothetical protein